MILLEAVKQKSPAISQGIDILCYLFFFCHFVLLSSQVHRTINKFNKGRESPSRPRRLFMNYNHKYWSSGVGQKLDALSPEPPNPKYSYLSAAAEKTNPIDTKCPPKTKRYKSGCLKFPRFT